MISKGPNICYLCDHTINALNSGDGVAKTCNCFPNYITVAGSAFCRFSPTNASTVTVQFMNQKNITCSSALTAAVSDTALDNYNCICKATNSIFNDLTGKCVVCSLGKVNGVTCKCPAGQDWNIFMMSCTSINPPGSSFNNSLYTKCMQSQGLASRKLVSYAPT